MTTDIIMRLIREAWPDEGEVYRDNVLTCMETARVGSDWQAKVDELFTDQEDRDVVTDFVSVTLEKLG